MGYEAIIDHFGKGNPYKKDDAQEEKFMEDLLLFLGKTYRHISIERSQGSRHLVMH
jgi:hypothetical protein